MLMQSNLGQSYQTLIVCKGYQLNYYIVYSLYTEYA